MEGNDGMDNLKQEIIFKYKYVYILVFNSEAEE